MEGLDRKVANLFNAQHAEEVARAHASRIPKPSLRVRDWVCVLRPYQEVATKSETWWVGPVPVSRRLGESSYKVLIKPGTPHAVHLDQTKPFVVGEPVELYHYAPGYRTEGVAQNEWLVDEIIDHRLDEDGKLMFLNRWEDFEQGQTTCDPVGNFVNRCSWKLPLYCKQHGISLDLIDYLRDHPLPDEE